MKKISNRGMTLLELLIVMVILATSLGLGVSFVNRQENIIKKTLRQFIALNRQLDSYAQLNKTIYRLVIHLNNEENSTWWVEQKTNLLPPLFEDSTEKKEDSEEQVPSFIMADNFFNEAQYLPGDLSFASVEYSKSEEEVSSGKAYIYYFPEGQTSQILLKLKSEKKYWSLLIDRFRGELTVLSGEKQLADLERQ